MRPKYYSILDSAVETGIESGWNSSHKHVDKPSAHSIKSAIHDHIMSQLTEYFDFETEIYD